MQNRTVDPGGSHGHLRACPVLGSWCALLCSEVERVGAAGDELQCFLEEIRWLFEPKPTLNCRARKSHADWSGSMLQEGRTEVTPSMAAQGYRMSETICCWEMLWSEEYRGASSLTATLRRGFSFSGHRLHGQHIPRQLPRIVVLF